MQSTKWIQIKLCHWWRALNVDIIDMKNQCYAIKNLIGCDQINIFHWVYPIESRIYQKSFLCIRNPMNPSASVRVSMGVWSSWDVTQLKYCYLLIFESIVTFCQSTIYSTFTPLFFNLLGLSRSIQFVQITTAHCFLAEALDRTEHRLDMVYSIELDGQMDNIHISLVDKINGSYFGLSFYRY